MADVSRLPQRIALINTCPQAMVAAGEHLLEDLRDALLAYDRLSGGSLARTRGEEGPSFIWVDGTKEPLEGDPCDTVVAALCDAAPNAPAIEMEARIAAAGPGTIAKGARLYAVVIVLDADPQGAKAIIPELESACQHLGIRWCGALAVAGGALIARHARQPRMGFLRRSRSEAIDRLIGAVRAGATVGEAAELFKDPANPGRDDLIEARCPIPRWMYRLMGDSAR
ncbi:MAG: hypothetical protein SOU51_04515 [Collinsella sp.]|nr:hypothetical protein [Collinsella sp.]